MDDEVREELALFRFALIAPLVSGILNDETQEEYLEKIAATTHNVPGLGQREFSPATLKRWLYDYRRHGMDGLKKKKRTDKGGFRSLNPEAAKTIDELIKANPDRTGVQVYKHLVVSDLEVPSLSTVQRYIKQKRNKLVEPSVERKRYEFEKANDCWQSDVLSGPHITVNGKKKKTYLIVFLDDASRLNVHSQFYYQENYLALEDTFKQALLKRGVPKKVFFDNGKIYQSKQLRLICARIGIEQSFARPYSPMSKGKIERWMRTYRNGFLKELEIDTITSLEHLNSESASFIENVYNKSNHSSLDGCSPLDRYLKDYDTIRFVEPKKMERYFLHEEKRKVTNDATISLKNTVFEVPQIFRGRKVKVLFNPHDLNSVLVKSPQDEELIPVSPVKTIDNSKIPRKQNRRNPIDYTELYKTGEGKHV